MVTGLGHILYQSLFAILAGGPSTSFCQFPHPHWPTAVGQHAAAMYSALIWECAIVRARNRPFSLLIKFHLRPDSRLRLEDLQKKLHTPQKLLSPTM
jgi:hypothetical protein